MHRTIRTLACTTPLALGLGAVVVCAGCSSGGAFTPPPIVAAPPAPPPPPPPPPPDSPAESPTGGSGPIGGGSDATPYTGSMDATELLVRSAMAYGEATHYLDEGSIVIVQPSRRSEYGFGTLYEQDGDFSFYVNGTAGSRLPHFEVHKVGRRFETVRSGSYGQAPTLEEAIVPFQNIMTIFTTNVPRILAGDHWGPTNDYETARVVGVTSVNGSPAIMIELDLIEHGPATVWLDQATLLIRRLSHDSPISQAEVTVTFTRLEAR